MEKKKVIITGILLFILINITLLVLDEDGKIDRVSHVKEWTQTTTMDMREQLEKDGIVSAEENKLYFDKSIGSFQEFVIEQGDRINEGDPLYTYTVNDYNTTWDMINNNIVKINEEIMALENIIQQMQSYSIPSSRNTSSRFSVNDDEYELDLPANEGIDSQLQKQQFILEKEKELAQKEAELTSLQNQLDELQDTGDTITVTSPYDGVVSQLLYTLEDPFITIINDDLYVKSELSEEERTLVTEGMEADIISEETPDIWSGSVSKVHETPQSIELNRKSVYPLEIEFMEEEVEEEVEVEEVEEVEDTTVDLLPGYHVDLAITLKESLNAVVLSEEKVDNHSIWIMNENGILQKQVIEKGIESASLIEIVTGLNEGQIVAYNNFEQFRNNTPFTTPLEIDKITWRTVKPENTNWKEHLVMGLLVR
ncbi:efflux RND transporter periplasmic adaptor subunit [Gracilibacillus xinjiangensis]|uniref:Efflux RND transporter periplasmic adaptor subunit n=1 Tax=Gracilibacillus xinjiangensis TaxID=1193282 RepID=A0ABV8WST8_9BACI